MPHLISREGYSCGTPKQIPWILMGDLNRILAPERLGGRPDPFLATARAFRDFIHDNPLLDIGFTGHKYTWNNCRHGEDCIPERLDRSQHVMDWVLWDPHAIPSHLPHVWPLSHFLFPGLHSSSGRGLSDLKTSGPNTLDSPTCCHSSWRV